MARALRLEYAGACYHVINRGNYRRDLFAEDGAAGSFEAALGQACERFGWRVHAYVIMRNHFHLAVELTEPNLSDGMKWLQGTFATRFNRFHGEAGRPFQGRYKALVVEPGSAFGQVCHYIHLNPVRAGVVAASAVLDFQRSSLPKFVGKQRPAWLDPVTVLMESGALPDDRHGWQRYVRYLEFLATDELAGRELVAAKMSRGWCIGSAGFRRDVREDARRRGADLERARFEGLEPAAVADERQAIWEERLKALARAGRIDLERLGAARSSPEKVLLAAALKLTTSVSNGWLAQRLEMGQPASASQFVRRLMLDPKGRRGVEKLLRATGG